MRFFGKKKPDAQGFTIVEIMVVVLLVSAIFGGIYVIFATGQSSWFTTETDIVLRNNLRQALQRISMELRQSRADKKFIFDNTGTDNTDILRFSVPILCETGDIFFDSSGDIPHWGAPLTWGCDSLTCMDQDQDCTVLEYKYVEYLVDADHELRREVLDESLGLVRSDLVARNIVDFQITVNGNMIAIDVTARKAADNNRVMTAQARREVFLRN